MNIRSGRRQRGFTLIEVVVAFALLALALTFLLASLSGAARQVRIAGDSSRATLYAQSLLAQVGVGETLQPGRRQGNFNAGRYRWVLDIAPYVDPLKRPSPSSNTSAPRLLHLNLLVEWGNGRGQQMQWQSLRLVQGDIDASTVPIQ
ncbi:MAG: prepilin-type N-terminal cleavage/methylation domain-containing protein [Pseudoxanthomonas sp.]